MLSTMTVSFVCMVFHPFSFFSIVSAKRQPRQACARMIRLQRKSLRAGWKTPDCRRNPRPCKTRQDLRLCRPGSGRWQSARCCPSPSEIGKIAALQRVLCALHRLRVFCNGNQLPARRVVPEQDFFVTDIRIDRLFRAAKQHGVRKLARRCCRLLGCFRFRGRRLQPGIDIGAFRCCCLTGIRRPNAGFPFASFSERPAEFHP